MLLREKIMAGGGEEGGEIIGGIDVFGAGFSAVAGGGVPHEQGDADAAFVEPAFSCAVGEVRGRRAFGGGEAAVVGGEDDDRVLRKAAFLQGIEHLPASGVHGLDHGGVNGVGMDGAVFAGRFRRELIFEP